MKNKAIGACRYLIRHAPHFRECLYLMFCKNGVNTFAYPSYLELFDSIPKDGFLSYGILIF